MLGAGSLFAITAWLASTPTDLPGDVAQQNGVEEAAERIQSAQAPVLAGGGPSDSPTSTTRAAGPLHGLTGAATALAIGDAALALQLVTEADVPEPGTETWFTVGALQGRAHRLAKDPAKAVEVLEPLASHKKAGSRFAKETLLLELAHARIDLARSGALAVADADAQCRTAIKELRRAGKLSPIRSLARMRVLSAVASSLIQGTSAHATKVAGTNAAKALSGIIKDYPKHPMIGVHRMMHAQALERAGKTKEAAEAFRRIAIERAGEPEEATAWSEYERIAAASRKVGLRPLLITERLDQAVSARVLRRVARSRQILDEIVDDPKTPSFLRQQALSSRAYTAYKQRDFARCADDLRPGWKKTGNNDLEGRLLRCLERGELYDEALEIKLQGTKSKRRGTKAHAYWQSLQLAFRAGKYAKTEALLDKYAKLSNANRGEQAWLRAWLPYRLGRIDEAIEALGKVPRKSPKDATRARYFRGKLMLASDDGELQEQGAAALSALASGQPWSYYGLQARQRLLDAGKKPEPLPALEPVADEGQVPSRADATTVLRRLDEAYGSAWPPIRRMRQLYAAGYQEEARRELRVATTAFLGLSSKTRSEEILEGLGWKAAWKFPKVAATKAGRKTMRDSEAKAALASGLRTLALAVDEPPSYVRLVPSSEAPRKARWHPRAYRAPIEREARVQDVDPIHLWSLMYTESRFRRHVVSHVGARGALQIMPWTGRQLSELLDEIPTGRFDADTLFDVDTNSHLASYYIAELLRKFQGQGAMAYASYNGGPSNVARWLRAKSAGSESLDLDTFIEEMVFTESYRYAKRVMEVSAAYSVLYRDELPRWTNTVDTKIEDNISF